MQLKAEEELEAELERLGDDLHTQSGRTRIVAENIDEDEDEVGEDNTMTGGAIWQVVAVVFLSMFCLGFIHLLGLDKHFEDILKHGHHD